MVRSILNRFKASITRPEYDDYRRGFISFKSELKEK
jgi:hypothetical protein